MGFKNEICYQIYPKSFQSTDKSVGNLRGIINRLDYLKRLGITLIWLCPINDSPMEDNGYDVRDYYKINPMFGTMDDFKELIDKAHQRGIKIMFDIVLNHTSSEHEWFKKSRNGDPYYKDFYIWTKKPVNWGSFFGGSAFEYDEVRQEYYLKLFAKHMPDLNWKNKNLRKEIKKIFKFYIDLGVDGFRLDAISHIWKDDFRMLQPENEIVYDYSKFSNLPEVHEMLKELNRDVFSKYDVITIGEIGGMPTRNDIISFCNNELNMIYTFAFQGLIKDGHLDIEELRDRIEEYQGVIADGAWLGLYWTNHDFARVMSLYGDEKNPIYSGSALATVMYFLKGTPFIYNGEELGMTNYPFKHISDFDDVKFKNEFLNSGLSEEEYISKYAYLSRDNARTIMQWDDSKYAGFSTAKPWFHINQNYKEINVKAMDNRKSLLNEYRKIINIRKSYPQFIDGVYKGLYLDSRMISYQRDNMLVLVNLSNEKIDINIPGGRVVYSNYDNFEKIEPYHAMVIELKK